MKIIETTVICKQTHFRFNTYLKPTGEPNYEIVPSRGDLPNVHFAALEGDFWIKATEIVAIVFEEETVHPSQPHH